MFSKIGNKNFTLLSWMLDITAAKQKVFSQNIANVNTPNYRRRTLNFKESLRDAMSKGTASAYANIQGHIEKPQNTPVRNNGNNVDIDLEMMNMDENKSFYKIYTTIYNNKSAMVKKAIRGRL